MKPNQLQLGFLKVLHGTRMEQEAEEYGLVYRSRPVYEVLYTRWLSFDDILKLKNVEDTVENYYNSGQFSTILEYVVPFFESPYDFYNCFGDYLQEQGYSSVSQSRAGRYMALRHFLQEIPRMGDAVRQEGFDMRLADELLSFDFCLRERLNRVPEFIPDQEPYKKIISDFFAREMQEGRWLGEEAKSYSYRQLRGRCQLLVLHKNVTLYETEKRHFIAENDTEVTHIYGKIQTDTGASELCAALFDYENRSPMSGNARVIWIPFAQLSEIQPSR
jgi:hypothetical protein